VQTPEGISRKLKEYRALVVIEDELRRSAIVDLLDDIGIKNTSTHSVEGALKKLKGYGAAGEDFSVIVADMVIGDGTANQLQQQSEALPSRKKTAMVQLVPATGRPAGTGFVEFQVDYPVNSVNLKVAVLNALGIRDFQTTASPAHSADLPSRFWRRKATR